MGCIGDFMGTIEVLDTTYVVFVFRIQFHTIEGLPDGFYMRVSCSVQMAVLFNSNCILNFSFQTYSHLK